MFVRSNPHNCPPVMQSSSWLAFRSTVVPTGFADRPESIHPACGVEFSNHHLRLFSAQIQRDQHRPKIIRPHMQAERGVGIPFFRVVQNCFISHIPRHPATPATRLRARQPRRRPQQLQCVRQLRALEPHVDETRLKTKRYRVICHAIRGAITVPIRSSPIIFSLKPEFDQTYPLPPYTETAVGAPHFCRYSGTVTIYRQPSASPVFHLISDNRPGNPQLLHLRL